jgi:MoaA/NifB/PqqE/SkfB family radical SAM enzyme
MTLAPPAVFLHLTRRCNMTCAHCHVSGAPDAGGDISRQTVRGVLQFLADHSIADLRLTGGEPTAHPDFENLLSEFAEQGYRPRLITNGLKLIKHRRPESVISLLSGCWISVYGVSETSHRAVGGSNSKQIERLLRFCADHHSNDCWIGISALLVDTSPAAVLEFMSRAAEIGVRRLRFLHAELEGRAKETGVHFVGRGHPLQASMEIAETIRGSPLRERFESVSMSDPFDIDGRFQSEQISSCLLCAGQSRRDVVNERVIR